MGPIWGRQDPGGPHVGRMNFAIWDVMFCVYAGCMNMALCKLRRKSNIAGIVWVKNTGQGDHFNIIISFFKYRNSHWKNNTVSRPSYLNNGNPYTRKNGLYIKTGARLSLDTLYCNYGLSCPSSAEAVRLMGDISRRHSRHPVQGASH